ITFVIKNGNIRLCIVFVFLYVQEVIFLKVKLFTDSDLDGLGCAIVGKLAFGENIAVTHCNYRNLNQRVEDFLKKEENKEVQLFITDLAVNPQVEKML